LKSTPPVAVPQDIRTQALHEEIAARARELWERYGRPPGRDVAIWLEAERQLLGADPDIVQLPGGAVSARRLRDAFRSGPAGTVPPPSH
jgi:hypothetical protein